MAGEFDGVNMTEETTTIKEVQEAVTSGPGLPKLEEDRRRLAEVSIKAGVWYAYRYCGDACRSLGRDGVLQCVHMALVDTARRFDVAFGGSYTTYMTSYVRHYLLTAAKRQHEVRDEAAVMSLVFDDPGDIIGEGMQTGANRTARNREDGYSYSGVRELSVDDRFDYEQGVRPLLDKLTKTQRYVVDLYLQGKNFRDISRALGRSKEGCRQAFLAAVVVLRHHYYAEQGEKSRTQNGLRRFDDLSGIRKRYYGRKRLRWGVAAGT